MDRTFIASPAKLTHMGYCGMPGIPVVDDWKTIRDAAASRIRSLRRQGFPVWTLAKGREWEIGEPEDCCMVPDESGMLRIKFLCDDCSGVTVDVIGAVCEDCEEARWEREAEEYDGNLEHTLDYERNLLPRG